MKLLFDENLSRKLVRRLDDLFPDSSHLAIEGLLEFDDRAIWKYAKVREFTIVTADGDFHALSTFYGPPLKVIWLRGCDYPTAIAEELIRGQAIRVSEFLRHPDQGVLILRP